MATASQTKPYSGPKDAKLPDHVKRMDDAARSTWVRTFNGVMAESDDEAQAMRLANAAARRKKAAGKSFADDIANAPIISIDLDEEALDTLTRGDLDVLASVAISEFLGKAVDPEGRKKEAATMPIPTPTLVALAKAHGHDLGAKCDMCGAMAQPVQPYGGATSFAELDTFREAAKIEGHISETTWQFQMLQQNILADEDMDAEEKANAIAGLAREFQTRVRNLPEEEKALIDGAKVGRRMNKQQAGLFKSAIESLKKLVNWADYADDDEDEKKAKALAGGAAKAHATGFKLYEQDGVTRWVAYSSNAFEDLEKELFTTKALDEAVTYADLSGERGPLRVFHIPGADVGPCDFQGIEGRVLIESGTFYDNPVGKSAVKFFKEAEKNGEDFGVSIGFLFEKGDDADGVYDWLRIKERSVTPAGRAANPFTSFSLGGIPMLTLTDEKKSFLERVVGKDNAGGIIAQASRATKALEDAGVKFKEDGSVDAAATAAAAGTADPTQAQAGAGTGTAKPAEASDDIGLEAVKELLAPFIDSFKGIEALALSVKALADRITELEKSDDEKIAAKMGPRSVDPTKITRPSEKSSNDVGAGATAAAVAAIKERNRVNGGNVDGDTKDDGDDGPTVYDPMAPYIADLTRTLGLAPASAAGAAAS